MKMFYSKLCPDCTNALAAMAEHGITEDQYEAVAVTDSMKNLREFIYFREENTAAFEPIRPFRAIGLPCFILDDGKISFDVNDLFK